MSDFTVESAFGATSNAGEGANDDWPGTGGASGWPDAQDGAQERWPPAEGVRLNVDSDNDECENLFGNGTVDPISARDYLDVASGSGSSEAPEDLPAHLQDSSTEESEDVTDLPPSLYVSLQPDGSDAQTTIGPEVADALAPFVSPEPDRAAWRAANGHDVWTDDPVPASSPLGTLRRAIQAGDREALQTMPLEELVQDQDANGETPLHWAVQQGSLDTIEAIMGAGAPLQRAADDGTTVLHYAAQAGRTAVVKLLVESDASLLDRSCESGTRALHLACLHGHLDTAKLLVELGADVNGRDEAGISPLHSASYGGHREITLLLLRKGGDASAKDAGGDTPRSVAFQLGMPAIVSLLEKSERVNAYPIM